MNNNKRPVMGKWKRTLIAAALTASMILALPVWNVGHAEAALGESGKLDLETPCTLTISRTVEDAKRQGNIVVDLYKVADATPQEGYDAYTLTLLEAYKGLKSGLDNATSEGMKDGEPNDPRIDGVNTSYRRLAQEAAEIALKPKPVESGEGENKTTVQVPSGVLAGRAELLGGAQTGTIEPVESLEPGLEPGMYLLIAHGKDLTLDQYVEKMTIKDDEWNKEDAPPYGSKEGTQIVTKAYADGYAYTYLPELISLPARVNADGTVVSGSFNTADTTHSWSTTLTATLKSEQSRELADLTITKNFINVPEDNLVTEDGCVFRIEAVLNGVNVYSNVETIYFKGTGGSETRSIGKKIPVGATVTVTEVSSGTAFTISGASSAAAMWNMGTRQYEVSFTNTYNGNSTGGNIINNRFTYNNGWNVDKDSLVELAEPEA